MKNYDYVIIGAGIAGSCVAHFLKDEKTLLVDRFDDVAQFASGVAGGFLSPLLGKRNKFKDLVTTSLKFAVEFYKELDEDLIVQKGVLRVPKDDEDRVGFEEYKKHFDFECEEKDSGFFFKIGSQVFSYDMCKKLTNNIDKKFNYDVKHIKKIDNFYIINDEIKTKNLILTTGSDIKLIDEEYIKIRAVWGQRIDISTTSCIDFNYHKECSISTSHEKLDNKTYKVSIGATHHRFDNILEKDYKAFENPELANLANIGYTNKLYKNDTLELLNKANNIKTLNNVKVLKTYFGARASSFDYFPLVGSLIDSKSTLNMFPYLKNGTPVKSDRFIRYENLFILNGVGGRGFVLSPYLAKKLVDFIKKNDTLEDEITVDRLFKKWVRRIK
ncbi:FAD-binding oxidoreductase [Arcobacter sp. F2176]|uniref:NAD(P)/FAD-dependent oxidoreductase n=1 Tax=Arcobacter sp. F2176 TaxID=2044511 RepID=UPI00100B1BB3|nr:FAD-dependent oxidoreductase [Arcobacter sp. F2176]RXJ80692.1 D-amino-acid oxidase [Arcobacter sp. F2176]